MAENTWWCVTPAGEQGGAVCAHIDEDDTYDTQVVLTTDAGAEPVVLEISGSGESYIFTASVTLTDYPDTKQLNAYVKLFMRAKVRFCMATPALKILEFQANS